MTGKAFLSVAVILASAAWARAEMKTLQLKDGLTVTGDVSETAAGYVVKSKYGSREISKGDVLKISDVLSFQAEYNQKLAGIDANSAEDHFKLAEWAYNANQAATAEKEARRAVEIDKDHAGAKNLLELLSAGSTVGPVPPPVPPVPGQVQVKPGEIGLVSAADINKIRLAELFDNENQLPIVFNNNVVKRFLDSNRGRDIAGDPKALLRFQQTQLGAKAVQMRDAVDGEPNAEDIKKDIEIKGDPRVVATMRLTIWPLVASRCGSRECHGGAKLNGLIRLVNRSDGGTPAAYTNFVLLDGMMVRHGERVIDRNEPERSLLLQFGLSNNVPPREGQVRHPKVKNWGPLYESDRDKNYRAVLTWIKSLRKDRPALSLDYTAPEGVTLDSGGSADGLLKGAEPLGGPLKDDADTEKDATTKPVKDVPAAGSAPAPGAEGSGEGAAP